MNQYTYSFNKKRTIFKNQYASGAQICDYLEETAKKFNIYDQEKVVIGLQNFILFPGQSLLSIKI